MAKKSTQSNAKYFSGILYPENMVNDWQTKIGDLLELPYCYCIHNMDKDTKSEHRKDHLHLIIAFPNTTTPNHAKNVMDRLSVDGRTCISTCQSVVNIRHMYDYLIHDTETCRKQGKELYSSEERISGNNFDIGAYEQIGIAEKNDMTAELCNVIRQHKFITFGDFFDFAMDNYVVNDSNYFEILKTYSGLFERLTKSNYQKIQFKKDFGTNYENIE